MSAEGEALRRVYAAALLAGCDGLDRAELLDRLGKLGALLSIDVGAGTISISLRAQRSALPGVLTLLRRILSAPSFDRNELIRIKRTLVGELAESREEARERAHAALRCLLFADGDRRATPDPDAIAAALPGIGQRELRRFHETLCNTFFRASVVGDAEDADRIHRFLARVFRQSAGAHPTDGIHEPQLPQAHTACIDIPSRTNIEFSVGGPLPLTLHHPDYLPFLFGMNVLAKWGGFAGRLMQRVREERGLTYMIYGRTESVRGSETGYWRIATFFSPADRASGLAATAAEIRTIAAEGITADEHARFHTIHHTQQALIADSPGRTLSHLHSFHCAGFDHHEIAAFTERFAAVTRDEVSETLHRYLRPEATYLGAAGALAGVENDISRTYGCGILES